VKLFQIEEPEGGPTDPDMPGAAIGIDASAAVVEVAISIGGNAVLLADRMGFEQELASPDLGASADQWEELFAGARLRAERALARPVTHAVIVLIATTDRVATARLTEVAERAGLALLRLAAAAELRSDTAPALAAALLAEDLAPPPEPGAALGRDFT
jgi:L-aminopeptidase/D-esterase-like protein